MRRLSSKFVSATVIVLVMASLLAGVGPLSVQKALGAQVLNRSLKLSNSVPVQTATYEVGFTIATADTLGSVKVEFCENTALFEIACDAPGGFDVSSAVLSSQTGVSGFTIDPATTANVLILSRTPSAQGTGPVTFTLDNVQNAAAAGTQYARYSTFATGDASGLETDKGAVAYALNSALSVNTEVPPFLQICLGVTISGTNCSTAQGDYVSMGEYSPSHASTGQTQVVVGTNAPNGYILSISGATMTSGNNVIAAVASPTVSVPGTSQFGVNLRANSNPPGGEDPSGAGIGEPTANYNQPNRFMYQSGNTIASSNNVEDFRKFTVTYLVNISHNQPPGVYSSTFTYTGLGNF